MIPGLTMIEIVGVVGIVGACVLWGFVWWFFANTCPQCGRRFAFTATGQTRTQAGPFFEVLEYEEGCKQCGHARWGMKPSRGGDWEDWGNGGDGGDE